MALLDFIKNRKSITAPEINKNADVARNGNKFDVIAKQYPVLANTLLALESASNGGISFTAERVNASIDDPLIKIRGIREDAYLEVNVVPKGQASPPSIHLLWRANEHVCADTIEVFRDKEIRMQEQKAVGLIQQLVDNKGILPEPLHGRKFDVIAKQYPVLANTLLALESASNGGISFTAGRVNASIDDPLIKIRGIREDAYLEVNVIPKGGYQTPNIQLLWRANEHVCADTIEVFRDKEIRMQEQKAVGLIQQLVQNKGILPEPPHGNKFGVINNSSVPASHLL